MSAPWTRVDYGLATALANARTNRHARTVNSLLRMIFLVGTLSYVAGCPTANRLSDLERCDMRNRVLVVDDSAAVRDTLRVHLEEHGLVVDDAEDRIDAIEKASAACPRLIVLNLSMARMNGLDAAPKLRQICPNAPIILHTIHAQLIRRSRDLPAGITEVVGKNENIMDRVLELLQEN
jgi:CheY-like chemotaxis protein